PIPLLLLAEAAARQGDADAARRSYARLLDRPDTEFLGLRGLIGQALRAGDDATALRLAEHARRLRPDAGWLLETLLVLEARAGGRAWLTAPHPDLARLYLDTRPKGGPLARAAAAQRLAVQNPSALESHLAVAEAALAAQLWGEARHHLLLAAAQPQGPSRQMC